MVAGLLKKDLFVDVTIHDKTTRDVLVVPTAAVLYGDRARLLAYDPAEHPLALQLGGSHPHELAQCAEMLITMGCGDVWMLGERGGGALQVLRQGMVALDDRLFFEDIQCRQRRPAVCACRRRRPR